MSEESAFVRSIPIVVFIIFAAFWSAWDIETGFWFGLLPSTCIGGLLLGHTLRAHREEG